MNLYSLSQSDMIEIRCFVLSAHGLAGFIVNMVLTFSNRNVRFGYGGGSVPQVDVAIPHFFWTSFWVLV